LALVISAAYCIRQRIIISQAQKSLGFFVSEFGGRKSFCADGDFLFNCGSLSSFPWQAEKFLNRLSTCTIFAQPHLHINQIAAARSKELCSTFFLCAQK